MSLFPVYGMQNGLDLATSANILSAMILGNVFLQFPIGALCNRFSGGMAMLASGSYGLPLSLALTYLVLALGVSWRQLTLRAAG